MGFFTKIFKKFNSELNNCKKEDKANNIDKNKYDSWQMKQITMGLDEGLDVSIYANPKYDAWQMSEIRIGIQRGLDVSVYADPEYNYSKMYEMRLELEAAAGKYDDIKNIYKNNFSLMQLEEIWQGLEKGLDVSIYADSKYDSDQMGTIRFGLEKGLDVIIIIIIFCLLKIYRYEIYG